MGKSAISSAGIIGALVAMIASLAPLVGWTLSETDQAALRTVIESGILIASNLIAFAGAAVALWGRWRATRQVTGTFTASPAPPLQASPPRTTAADLNAAELERIRQGGRV